MNVNNADSTEAVTENNFDQQQGEEENPLENAVGGGEGEEETGNYMFEDPDPMATLNEFMMDSTGM